MRRDSHLGESLAFFFCNVPKVLLLPTLVVFAMGVVRQRSLKAACFLMFQGAGFEKLFALTWRKCIQQ